MNLIEKIEKLKAEFLPIQNERKGEVSVKTEFTFHDIPLSEIKEYAELHKLTPFMSNGRDAWGICHTDFKSNMVFTAWSKSVVKTGPKDHFNPLFNYHAEQELEQVK